MYRLCALIGLIIGSCAVAGTESATAPQADEFAASISDLKRADPTSPAVLSLRLSYAEFLLSTDEGPCQPRIARAQQELGQVEADPRTAVMFPDGWPRTVELEYRLHLAQADCTDTPGRAAQLRAAVAAARHASDLYADSFDYHAAVIMQYNTAIILHQLGDAAAAMAALDATLAMDREFGFQADAEENYQLQLTWQGQTADRAQVAARMRDFPNRRAVLKFAWHAVDAHISIEDTRTSLWDGAVVHSHGADAYERHVTADPNGGWLVAYTQNPGQYQPGVWPTQESSQPTKAAFTPASVAAPNFKVDASGEFGGTLGADALSAAMIAQTDDLIRTHAPAGHDADKLIKQALDTTQVAFSSGLLVAQGAENYQLETSMWVGATLDQGVWYQLSAPLSLRGMPRVVLQQELQFAFARMVPCTAEAPDRSCVELLVRTSPDQDAVDRLIRHYVSTSITRLILDPATLLCYSREDRLYWYASVGTGHSESILQSEHFKSTATLTSG